MSWRWCRRGRRLYRELSAPIGRTNPESFGVTLEGYKVEHTAEQQRQAESGRKVELTPLQKKLRP
jgi:hypothetical protein